MKEFQTELLSTFLTVKM